MVDCMQELRAQAKKIKITQATRGLAGKKATFMANCTKTLMEKKGLSPKEAKKECQKLLKR